MDANSLSTILAGRTVSHVANPDPGTITVNFTDGSTLIVEHTDDGVLASIRDLRTATHAARSKDQPTPRQREYLQFISTYMLRRGLPPAESDIQQHFMVSAPSAHEMIKTLERRGFITRDRDFYGQALPRSIRVVINLF